MPIPYHTRFRNVERDQGFPPTVSFHIWLSCNDGISSAVTDRQARLLLRFNDDKKNEAVDDERGAAEYIIEGAKYPPGTGARKVMETEIPVSSDSNSLKLPTTEKHTLYVQHYKRLTWTWFPTSRGMTLKMKRTATIWYQGKSLLPSSKSISDNRASCNPWASTVDSGR